MACGGKPSHDYPSGFEFLSDLGFRTSDLFPGHFNVQTQLSLTGVPPFSARASTRFFPGLNLMSFQMKMALPSLSRVPCDLPLRNSSALAVLE